MHPILFTWGPLTVRWYGAFIALGFLTGHWMFQKRGQRLGLNPTECSNLVLILFLGGILGARVYYVLLHWPDYRMEPWELLRIDHGGLVFFGGFGGALAALWSWSRWKKRPIASLADALAPSLAIGHAFGRLGCFMNGCCYGRACDHFWAVRLESPPEVANLPVHPTQLYEFFGLLDIFFTLLILEKLRRYPGYVICSQAILYSLLRFIVEFFRGDVPRAIAGRFTLAQGISAGLFFVAWIVSVRLARQNFKTRGREILRT